ncbi:MAG: tetratricopeptide repeat protein [Termitinemataceae bacterium]|nr:MAG: tetratricopeptide repeat protein [Termitinemataceae bacterium]
MKKRVVIFKIKNTLTKFFAGVLLFGVLGGGGYLLWQYQTNKTRYDYALKYAEFGPRKGTPRTIEELQRAIASYEHIQDLYIKASAQTGTYWKILGLRYQDKEMFLESLAAFERALEYTPNDEMLHYFVGLNSAMLAKSMYDKGTGRNDSKNSTFYFNVAETAYKRALELEPKYTQVLYALAVIYIFELNRPEEGIQQLTQYLEIRSSDADAMLLMARAYYMTGDNNIALDWYDRAIPLLKDNTEAARRKKAEAAANRDFVRSLPN